MTFDAAQRKRLLSDFVSTRDPQSFGDAACREWFIKNNNFFIK
jgi:hypothetical protein